MAFHESSFIVRVKTLGSTITDYFLNGKNHPRGKTADGTCGEADDIYSIDNMDQMQRYDYFALSIDDKCF